MPVMVCITIDYPKQCQTKYVGHFFKDNITVTCLIAEAWNGMWTDMMSGDKTNLMRYGKGPRGLIGITVKPAGKVWTTVSQPEKREYTRVIGHNIDVFIFMFDERVDQAVDVANHVYTYTVSFPQHLHCIYVSHFHC